MIDDLAVTGCWCAPRADPVYAVSSVNICTTFWPCHVYGSIQIIDPLTNTMCEVYRRGSDDAEPITSETQPLALLTTSECDVLYMRAPQLLIDLKAKDDVDDLSISKGTLPFPEIIGDELEQRLSLTVPSELGHACVRYMTFPFALTANFEIEIALMADKGYDHTESDIMDIYGKITAYPIPDYGWAGVLPGTELFSRSGSRFETITIGSPLKLDKSRLAVPAYSSLRVEVCLIKCGSDEVLLKDEVVFETFNGRETLYGKNFDLGLDVEWVVPFDLDQDEGPKGDLKIEDWLELPNSKSPGGRPLFGSKLVEVFSVCIFRENNAPLSIFGNINYMANAENVIYGRTKNNPQLLTHGEKYLSLESPLQTLCYSRNFYLYLKLKDITGRFAISGRVPGIPMLWNNLAHWFDRPNCSIVKGDNGFAAVYYSVFSSAVKASVKVFYCKGDSNTDISVVHGVVAATYGECRESCSKQCRIVMFDGFFEPSQGSEFQLSRSMIASPLNQSLLLHVNLYANSKDGESLCDTVTFVPDGFGSSKLIMGRDFGVRIVVEWGRPDKENF